MRSREQLPSSRLGLRRCFALPPCVQRQNHTQAVERKTSASAVIVSNGNTPGRRRKRRRQSAACNHGQLSEGPNPSLSPALGGGCRGERPSQEAFHLKISIPCIFSLFFMRTREGPLTFVPCDCHKSVLRLKDILFKRGC